MLIVSIALLLYIESSFPIKLYSAILFRRFYQAPPNKFPPPSSQPSVPYLVYRHFVAGSPYLADLVEVRTFLWRCGNLLIRHAGELTIWWKQLVCINGVCLTRLVLTRYRLRYADFGWATATSLFPELPFHDLLLYRTECWSWLQWFHIVERIRSNGIRNEVGFGTVFRTCVGWNVANDAIQEPYGTNHEDDLPKFRPLFLNSFGFIFFRNEMLDCFQYQENRKKALIEKNQLISSFLLSSSISNKYLINPSLFCGVINSVSIWFMKRN